MFKNCNFDLSNFLNNICSIAFLKYRVLSNEINKQTNKYIYIFIYVFLKNQFFFNFPDVVYIIHRFIIHNSFSLHGASTYELFVVLCFDNMIEVKKEKRKRNKNENRKKKKEK